MGIVLEATQLWMLAGCANMGIVLEATQFWMLVEYHSFREEFKTQGHLICGIPPAPLRSQAVWTNSEFSSHPPPTARRDEIRRSGNTLTLMKHFSMFFPKKQIYYTPARPPNPANPSTGGCRRQRAPPPPDEF